MKKACITVFFLAALIVSMFAGCQQQSSDSESEALRIGVTAGTIFDQYAKQEYPDGQIQYFNAVNDLPVALKSHKIDLYIDDEPTARLYSTKYTNQEITRRLVDDNYALIFPLDNTPLRDQFNEFLEGIRDNGTLSKLNDIYFGNEEEKKAVDMSGLTGENGTVNAFIAGTTAPFDYVQDGKYTGFEVAIMTAFCREYGYGLHIENTNFSGVITAVSAGKADIGAACISITEERKRSMLFSEPIYYGGIVQVENKKTNGVLSVTDLAGRSVGVQNGSIAVEDLRTFLPDSDLKLYDSITQMAEALEDGDISAYAEDEPMARLLIERYPSQKILTGLSEDSYAFAFPLDKPQSILLRALFNDFLQEIATDGTLNAIDDIWFGQDKEDQSVDFSDLPAVNGTLHLAISTEVGAPFAFKENGKYLGYDIDLAVRFCRKCGYGLEITDHTLSDMFAVLEAGECDMACSGIFAREERKEKMLFSDPVYDGGVAVVTKRPSQEPDQEEILCTEDLSGGNIGVLAGTIFDQTARKYIYDCAVKYYNSGNDLADALKDGMVDAYITDEPIARCLNREYNNQHTLTFLTMDSYGIVLPKRLSRSADLLKQLNDFLQASHENGVTKEIDGIWFGTDWDAQTVDMDDLTGENGTLSLAVCTNVGEPFCYRKDDRIVGYDIDLIVRFCREYGYGLRVTDYTFADMLSAVSSGKCDLAASGITITEARKGAMFITEPIYNGGSVLVVPTVSGGQGTGKLVQRIWKSFSNTFIEENRWQLFLSGIGVTLLVALLSVLFGTALGFLLYLLAFRTASRMQRVLDGAGYIIEKSPVVVILMILYYIVFGKAGISGITVSIIGLSVLFANSVIRLLRMGVSSVSKGQQEAALALGYSERSAFVHIVLPQAVQRVLPGYQSAIVSLIKDTAIVGYIAVQDLTRVSDIIRSRTYEAFFPLIVSAIIYVLIAVLLITIVKKIQIRMEPRKRKEEDILKGIVR